MTHAVVETSRGQVSVGPPVLSVRGLTVEFGPRSRPVRVVEDISFDVGPGEVLGVVGESGSGKSVTALAVMGLLGGRGGRITSGSVLLHGRDLATCTARQMRRIRGAEIGMIFQQAPASLNPSFTVGEQIAEVLRRHGGLSRKDANEEAVALLDQVGIARPRQRARSYPHELSGGMCQRVSIAIALACKPRLLIADEPTTALDVRVQRRVLDLLAQVNLDTGIPIIFISHDLSVIAEMSDRVAVLYAGQIVEAGDVGDVLMRPKHPYTAGLLHSIPVPGERLVAIEGAVPLPGRWELGCRFAPRCEFRQPGRCDSAPIPLHAVEGGSTVRCVRSEELHLQGVRPDEPR
jgi:oligopeptide/dipeptide ABC transporter ATP-binding protein